MPLNGCRCRLCRQYQDLADVRRDLEKAAVPLQEKHQRLLDEIVRDAFERMQRGCSTVNGDA